jgi:hypothetical protein
MLLGVNSVCKTKTLPLILLLVVAICGALVILVATRWGIGASPDSVSYLGAAQNISAGRGFSLPTAEGIDAPVTQWPPFYSWLLAEIGRTGLGVRSAARWLNALLTMANLLLMGVILLPYGKRGAATATIILAGGLLLLVSPAFLEIHLMAWSEPLFIFLGMSGLLVLGGYLDGKRFTALLVATLLVGLAFLTRFTGAALVATGMIGLLLFSGEKWLRRISDLLLFGLVSSLPIIIWMVSNIRSLGEATSRELNVHPIGLMHLNSAVTTLSSWLLVSENAPGLVKVGTILCVLLALALIYYVGVPRSAGIGDGRGFLGVREIPGFVKLFMLFIPGYVFFLIISITFFDANTPLDSRILSPVFVIGMVLIFWLLLVWEQSAASSKWIKILIGVVGCAFVLGYLVQDIGSISQAYREGIGFNSLAWYHSATLAAVKRLPSAAPLFTNVPEAIYFHTGRAVNEFPKKSFSSDQKANANYLAELEAMENKIREQRGYIVFFNRLIRPTMPSEGELNQSLSLRLLRQFDDGALYLASQEK